MGSDYIASYMNKGKVRPLGLMRRSKAHTECFAELGEKKSTLDKAVAGIE